MKFILLLSLITTFTIAKEIHVQGHRGARAVLPENTLEGFQYAMDLGVGVLELDLAVTMDDQVIISHDPVVNTKLCHFNRKNFPFSLLTLKQVKEIDCGSKKNPNFPKQKPIPKARIPTLAELFEMVKSSQSSFARKVQFNIEIKIFPQYPSLTPGPQKFAKLTYDVIKKYGMVERSIIQSFDYRPLVAIKALDSRLRLAFLNGQSLPDFVPIAQRLKAHIISPNQHWITKDQVQALNKIGVQTIPWTANTEKEWAHLVQIGVDGIITDDPEGLIRWLRKQGLRSDKSL
ncbi:MAG: glycerophosphodiester phosphodiesterase family protein [Bdellovibrionales bacterium]|nr:glycerophosphodiester phosphodiesterase family protein [Bdellovibrionales bacterium]